MVTVFTNSHRAGGGLVRLDYPQAGMVAASFVELEFTGV
jgi:hypothetical protein